MNVAVADIDLGRAEAVARELEASAQGRAVAIALDVSDPEAWERAAEVVCGDLGEVSVLCNNAGAGATPRPVEETEIALWRWIVDVNVNAHFYGLRAFLPRMKAAGGPAHIVATSSMVALTPAATLAAYTTSKFASLGLSLVLREELAGTGIGVSILCPGSVRTRMAITALEAQERITARRGDAEVADIVDVLADGMDPDLVGQRVMAALHNGDFYIFTHPDWAPAVARVHGEIAEAFAKAPGEAGRADRFLSFVGDQPG